MIEESLIGTMVAGFRLDAVLGRGGAGVVYLAEASDGSRAALKLMAESGDHEVEHRFLREVRLAQALKHPHVIPIFAAGEDDGHLFLAMRYIDGGDLRQLLVREGALPVDRTLGLLSGIASALDAAHHHNLIHRDVKPGNILVQREDAHDHAYLADFGLAKHHDDTSLSLSLSGQLLGTVDYMAPEQIRGDPTVDGRADVYSLGCVLYQCLTGMTPYRGTDVAVLWAQMQDEPPRLADTDPALERLDPILAKALAKEPASRYSTAGEFIDDLNAAYTNPHSTAPAHRRRLTAMITVGAIGLAVVAAISLAHWSSSGVGRSSTPRSHSTPHASALGDGFAVNNAVPDIRLPVLQAATGPATEAVRNATTTGVLNISRLRGHPVVVNFWASWCAECTVDVPLLSAGAEAYPGVTFIGIDEAEHTSLAGPAFLRQFKVPYTNLADPTGRVGVSAVPFTLFINSGGVVEEAFSGPVTPGELQTGLDAIGAVQVTPTPYPGTWTG